MLTLYYLLPFIIVFGVVWWLTGSKVLNFNYRSATIRLALGLACFLVPLGYLSTRETGIKAMGDAYNWWLSLLFAGVLLTPIGLLELIGATIKRKRRSKGE